MAHVAYTINAHARRTLQYAVVCDNRESSASADALLPYWLSISRGDSLRSPTCGSAGVYAPPNSTLLRRSAAMHAAQALSTPIMVRMRNRDSSDASAAAWTMRHDQAALVDAAAHNRPHRPWAWAA